MSDQQYKLTLSKGPQPGKIYILMTDVVIMGRDPMADVSLNDPEVSRQHVKLIRTESGYDLEDLGSTNGTFINGSQITANHATPLETGQTIGMGSGITLLFDTMRDKTETTVDPAAATSITASIDDPFVAESLFIPETAAEQSIDDANIAFDSSSSSSELDEPTPSWESAPAAEPMEPDYASTSAPLVPASEDGKAKKRRRNVTIAVVSLLFLCCCCLLFLLSAYYYWGDPLLESLGLYG